ncbi:hypothetical protein SLE2022_261730 [Rubroshorea leprosula]
MLTDMGMERINLGMDGKVLKKLRSKKIYLRRSIFLESDALGQFGYWNVRNFESVSTSSYRMAPGEGKYFKLWTKIEYLNRDQVHNNHAKASN